MKLRLSLLFAILFSLAALSGCANEPGAQDQDTLAGCQEVTSHVNACLEDYCAETGDERLCAGQAQQTSLLGSSTGCDSLSADALKAASAASCDVLVGQMLESVSGKADALCPVYFPWCEAAPVAQGYQIEVIDSHEDGITFEITLDELIAERREMKGSAYQALAIPGQGTTRELGFPEVPVVNIYVGAPAGVVDAKVEVFEPLETESFKDLLVWPAQPWALQTEDEPEFVKIDYGYDLEGPYPEDLYLLDPLAVWRDYKAVRLQTHPLRLYPSEGRLEVMKRFRVTLSYVTMDGEESQPGESTFAAAYGQNLVNYETVRQEATRDDGARPRYLFIVEDELTAAVAPLVAWKRERGLEPLVIAKSEIFQETSAEKNHDANLIKETILNAYLEHHIEYVLLVGDLEQIPMYEEEDNRGRRIYGDYRYACLEGDDLLPEVAIGRMLGTPEEVGVMVEKTLEYERGDRLAAWRQQVLLVAHEEDAPGKYTGCSDSIWQRSYETPAAFSKAYGADEATNEDVIAAMNRGLGLLNYRGHGDVGFWSEWNGHDFVFDDYEVANEGMTPVVFSIACLNAQVHQEEQTLAEQFVKRDKGGAVAFLGATKPSWTKQNHDFNRFLFEAVLDEGIRPIGQVVNAANVALLKKWTGEHAAEENAKMYIWLGDPSIELDLGRRPEEPLVVGWCNLQHPETLTEEAALPKTDVYAQIWSEGWTDQPGQSPFLTSQFGYGPVGTNPEAGDEGWVWTSGFYHLDVGNNDEYMGRLNIPEVGDYAYAFRVSGDAGQSWRYCDLDGSDNGFSAEQLGQATVVPRPVLNFSDVQLAYPYSHEVAAGEKMPWLKSYVDIHRVDWNEALIPFIDAELGVGPEGTHPDESDAWVWTAGERTYAYSGMVYFGGRPEPLEPGVYSYAFRMTQDKGETWDYADSDGGTFTADRLGTITISEPAPEE